MIEFKAAVWAEWRKLRRSRLPILSAVAFLMVPLMCAVLMFIYKDPEFARESGLIGAKANLMGGTADWPTFMNMLGQAIAIGGIVLFGLILIWIFGREYADNTLKDLLALPTPRHAILLAKFCVAGAWSAMMTVMIYAVGLVAGWLVGMPGGTPAVLLNGTLTFFLAAVLVIIVETPIAFFANLGRGYLLPFGVTVFVIMLANVLAILGWGEVFPWSVPAIAARVGSTTWTSVSIVLVTCAVGIAATWAWWRYQDLP